MGVTPSVDGAAFPHPLSRRVQVPARPRPAPVSAAQARLQAVQRQQRILRLVLRTILFYATAAALIVVGIGIHEYSHYAAHEGFGVPELAYSDSVQAAQAELLQVERTRGPAGDVLVQQPEATTIVFFPNTFLQAAGLGLLPSSAYADDGVLASTYFHLDGTQADGVRSRGGQMPAMVVAAPLLVSLGIFLAALAWTLVRPTLFGKALLVAYAVQLGDAGHHASALGMSPEVFYILSTLLVVLAAILVAVRTLRPAARATAKPARPDLRPATRVIVRASKGRTAAKKQARPASQPWKPVFDEPARIRMVPSTGHTASVVRPASNGQV